jgi:glycosyltransferase involved in cell wall biosynthesis
MTACLFGTYVRPHSANRLLRHALGGAGYAVVECHEALWEETPDKGRGYFRAGSLVALGARWLVAARRLARRWRSLGAGRAGSPPLVVVGFGGQLDVLLARRLCRPRAGLVFAPLVSLTETLVEDRGVLRAGGLGARALAALDRATFRAADVVLADTAAHAEYLRRLGAPPGRVAAWPLGVEPEFLSPVSAAPAGRRVLFYGRCLPLHGIDTIVRAAARLGDRAEVVLIGSGPERARVEGWVRAGRAPVVLRDPVPFAALPGELARAAVVLGVFGAGPKAAMVVPNKVWQAAAAGRPLVTRDGAGLREVLEPDRHCLACPPADPEALADAVLRLLEDPGLAGRLGAAARAHVLERFAPERQAARLRGLVAERLGVVPAGVPADAVPNPSSAA